MHTDNHKTRFHIIHGKHQSLVYDPFSNSIFKCDSIDDHVLNDINNKISKRTLTICSHTDWLQDNCIDQFTLIVTTQCNLACKYCYADQGSFNGYQQENMTPDKAVQYIGTLLSSGIRTINRIMFFGGEPFLATDTIRTVCEYVTDAKDRGILDKIPQFLIITNLTICNTDIYDLVKKYDISLTVSIDGPAVIHDIQRVDHNNRGSFSVIEKNFELLRDNIHAIEATYSMNHVRHNISINQLKTYLSDHFSIPPKYISVVPVVGCERLFVDPVKYRDMLIDDILNIEDSSLLAILDPSRQSDLLCSAGYRSLSVTPNGDIYPCHMYTVSRQFRLTNFHEFNDMDYIRNLKDIIEPEHIKGEKCSECWAYKICHICPAKKYLTSDPAPQITDDLCNQRRKHFEMILKKVTGIDQ